MPDDSRFCFVICPIGDPESETRKRADGLLTAIIRPAVVPLGFHAERADHEKGPGTVTDAIIQKVATADLVIADLANGPNPNVMYELAIRHAVRKPVVQMTDDLASLPFDIQVLNTISYDVGIHQVAAAITALSKAAAQAMTDASLGNPIVNAIQLRALENAGNEQATILAMLAHQVSSMGRTLAQVSNEIQEMRRPRQFSFPVTQELLSTPGLETPVSVPGTGFTPASSLSPKRAAELMAAAARMQKPQEP